MTDSYEEMNGQGTPEMTGFGMSLRELYDERKPLYERYAEVTVNVDDLSITAAARKVADALAHEGVKQCFT